VNRHFSVKPNATPLGFQSKLDIFKKTLIFLYNTETSIRDRI
jgi:hypothetical protein